MGNDKWIYGSCQCQGIRYRIVASEILTLYRCHCTECQKQSASSFGLSLKVPRAGFELICGELAQWTRRGKDGKRRCANFCPTCGCRVYHGGPEAPILSLKAGLLDGIATLTPVGNIWTDSATSASFPSGDICYPKQPPDYDALYRAWDKKVGS